MTRAHIHTSAGESGLFRQLDFAGRADRSSAAGAHIWNHVYEKAKKKNCVAKPGKVNYSQSALSSRRYRTRGPAARNGQTRVPATRNGQDCGIGGPRPTKPALACTRTEKGGLETKKKKALRTMFWRLAALLPCVSHAHAAI